MPNLTETARVNRLILLGAGRGMTALQFFAAEIREWRSSQKRMEQIKGEEYYDGKQDILERKRQIIGEGGELQEVKNLPNNQLIDNQYALMVDQKTNYLVGKPFTVNCENKNYVESLNQVFDRKFHRLLKYICEDALKTSIGWLHPYYNEAGELAFKHFPAYEILPFWKDDDHTELDCALRFYPQEAWDGYTKKTIYKVELFDHDGIYRYIFEGDTLIPDVEAGEHDSYFTVYEGDDVPPKGMNWTKIPLIPFKYCKQELTLLHRVKSLQDAINTILSDFENNMQEDARNTILVLRDYDGQDLGQFRHNLATFGAVKVRGTGDVATLTVEVNSENYKSILDLLNKALIKNARGYDAKDDRLTGNPNQMNIQSMYSDIDLDANGMETELQASFDDLLWFINSHFANSGMGDFTDDVTIVFNRDILINESESIENCSKSVGILSDETIVEQHPWVKDVEMEMARKKKEKEEVMENYMGQFPFQNTNDPNNPNQGGVE